MPRARDVFDQSGQEAIVSCDGRTLAAVGRKLRTDREVLGVRQRNPQAPEQKDTLIRPCEKPWSIARHALFMRSRRSASPTCGDGERAAVVPPASDRQIS